MQNKIIFQISCEDQSGIVAKVSSAMHHNGGNILKLEQHVEEPNFFFMRLEVMLEQPLENNQKLLEEIQNLKQELNADINWQSASYLPKVAILVGKEPHCLIDLLAKKNSSELDCEITAVISNWPDAEKLCKQQNVAFHHLPIELGKEQNQEEQIEQILEKTQTDLIVLARYMRVLSKRFVSKYNEQIINIHHGFLPAFKGARPYKQAWEHGVKVIGASAHYATENLDEGPILSQDVQAVSHYDDEQAMIRLGRDIEPAF